MSIIERGANTPLTGGQFRITVARAARPGATVVAAAAVLLDSGGKVRGDADVVLAGGPRHPSGAVRNLGGAQEAGLLVHRLEVDPDDVEPAVQRILITAVADGGTFGSIGGLSVEVAAGDGSPMARYEVTDAAMDTALVLGECYRRSGSWRFRAMGQGYTSGPAALAADYGIRPQALPAAPVAGPAMTEVDKVDEAPAPAPLPSPSPEAGPSPASRQDRGRPGSWSEADCLHEGDGDQLLTLVNPDPGHLAVLEYEALGATDSDTWFTAYRLDEQDQKTLVFYRGDHGLRGQLLAFGPGSRDLRLSIEASCRWRLRLRPADTAEDFGTGTCGRGSTVLWYAGPPSLLRVEGGRRKDEHVHVATVQADGGAHLVANANHRHPVTGPLAVGPEGWAHLVVQTSEAVAWKVEVVPLNTAPALERKLTGQGPAVVLVRGTGAKVEVRHDKGKASITPLFALDEYLIPGERLCAEPGVYAVPPGLVTVRARGKWSLRISG